MGDYRFFCFGNGRLPTCFGCFVDIGGNQTLLVKLSGIVWFWGVYEHLFGMTWGVGAQVGVKRDVLLVLKEREERVSKPQRAQRDTENRCISNAMCLCAHTKRKTPEEVKFLRFTGYMTNKPKYEGNRKRLLILKT